MNRHDRHMLIVWVFGSTLPRSWQLSFRTQMRSFLIPWGLRSFRACFSSSVMLDTLQRCFRKNFPSGFLTPIGRLGEVGFFLNCQTITLVHVLSPLLRVGALKAFFSWLTWLEMSKEGLLGQTFPLIDVREVGALMCLKNFLMRSLIVFSTCRKGTLNSSLIGFGLNFLLQEICLRCISKTSTNVIIHIENGLWNYEVEL